jgi:hypothetical protein
MKSFFVHRKNIYVYLKVEYKDAKSKSNIFFSVMSRTISELYRIDVMTLSSGNNCELSKQQGTSEQLVE